MPAPPASRGWSMPTPSCSRRSSCWAGRSGTSSVVGGSSCSASRSLLLRQRYAAWPRTSRRSSPRRALQGVGGALLMPASLAILQAAFAHEDRGRAIGAWSGLTGVAAAIGPFAGGWLVEVASWRWVFLINLPVAFGRGRGRASACAGDEEPRRKQAPRPGRVAAPGRRAWRAHARVDGVVSRPAALVPGRRCAGGRGAAPGRVRRVGAAVRPSRCCPRPCSPRRCSSPRT